MSTRRNSPEAALDKVFELAMRLNAVIQSGLAERGLTASRAEVLLVLAQDGPMVQRQISESLRCTPRYVTALIDGLEGEGLVQRRPHPTDRRATLVSLTRRGSAAASRMVTERQQAASWLLGDVSADDLDTFVAVADQLLDRMGATSAPATTFREPRQSRAADSRVQAAKARRTRKKE